VSSWSVSGIHRSSSPAPGRDAAEQPSTDQVIATTSARPLPTLTPTPVRLNPVARVVSPSPPGDPGAPLRIIGSVVGVIAAVSLLGALVIRHRLRRAQRHPLPED
jgi:hypothetical protein